MSRPPRARFGGLSRVSIERTANFTPVIERVDLDEFATHNEVDGVVAVFREYGYDVDVGARWRKPAGVGNGAFWLVLALLGIPVWRFLMSFADAAGKAAGEDAWRTFKGLVEKLRETRQGAEPPDGWVQFEDPNGTTLMLADYPDEAYEVLFELEEERFEDRRLVMWDEDRRRWYDPNTGDISD